MSIAYLSKSLVHTLLDATHPIPTPPPTGQISAPPLIAGIGSTSVTADADGNLRSRTLYSAWGEVRYASGALPTDYTYTGQYSNTADFGLMYYRARWYDPSLGRFSQADTIVPGAMAIDFDRYAYVRNSPLRYSDPSGHGAYCGDDYDPGCLNEDEKFDLGFLENVELKNITSQDRRAIREALRDIAKTVGNELNTTNYSDAFFGVFSGDNALTFQRVGQTCASVHGVDCWGSTTGTTITFFSDSAGKSGDYFNNFIVHETGHAFDNVVGLALTNGYAERLRLARDEGWTPMPTGYDGYASSSFPSLWIQGDHTYMIDQTADMFLGWVYNSWGRDTRRKNWMALWMPYLLRGTTPDYVTQFDYHE